MRLHRGFVEHMVKTARHNITYHLIRNAYLTLRLKQQVLLQRAKLQRPRRYPTLTPDSAKSSADPRWISH